LKPAQAIVRSYLKIIDHKKSRAGGVAQRVSPEFKPQYHKNKQQTKNSMGTELVTN
jgi:hypothetical protein